MAPSAASGTALAAVDCARGLIEWRTRLCPKFIPVPGSQNPFIWPFQPLPVCAKTFLLVDHRHLRLLGLTMFLHHRDVEGYERTSLKLHYPSLSTYSLSRGLGSATKIEVEGNLKDGMVRTIVYVACV